MLNKNIFLYLIIIAFFLSFHKWDNLFTGISNFLFSIIYVVVSFLLIKIIFNTISSLYGITCEFDVIYIEKAKKYYDFSKKDTREVKKRYNFSYILTFLIGILSAGFLLPILLSLDFIVIESKRLGKSKYINVTYSEKAKIIFLSLITAWILFSIIKYLSSIGSIFYGFIYYLHKFLLYYTISSIIPFCFILSPIISSKMEYKYLKTSIGDIFLLTKKPFLIASTSVLLFLSVFSIVLDPILLILISFIIYLVVWLRKTAETI